MRRVTDPACVAGGDAPALALVGGQQLLDLLADFLQATAAVVDAVVVGVRVHAVHDLVGPGLDERVDLEPVVQAAVLRLVELADGLQFYRFDLGILGVETGLERFE